jgi:hypothetical protein
VGLVEAVLVVFLWLGKYCLAFLKNEDWKT